MLAVVAMSYEEEADLMNAVNIYMGLMSSSITSCLFALDITRNIGNTTY